MRRVYKATGIVLALFTGVLCIDACVNAGDLLSNTQSLRLDHAGKAGGAVLSEEGSLDEQGDALQGISTYDAFVLGDSEFGNEAFGGDAAANLPACFEEELFAVGDFHDIQVDDSNSVVGLLFPGSAEEAFRSCKREMEEKGWTSIASGQENTETYIKQKGAYTWALVSCLDVAGEASVVVQIV